MKAKRKLFIIDFDLTITQNHIHNLLANKIRSGSVAKDDLEGQWQLVKHVLPTGNKDEWHSLFDQMLKAKHLVAIASFSAYPKIIRRYLKEQIGLNEAMVKKILIESWLPADPYANKNKHIQRVIDYFAFDGEPEAVIVIDDSPDNCLAAAEKGYQTIQAISGDASGQHLKRIQPLLKEAL